MPLLLVACARPARAQGTPVACRDAGARAPAVDSAQLVADLFALADDSMEGRGFATAGGARARRFLQARFRALGLDSLAPGYAQPVRDSSPRTHALREGANLVGVLRGRGAPDTVLVVSAHYDHLGMRRGVVWNGSDDNASGVAALLAVARELRRAPPLHTVLLVAFDGEEEGELGSAAFVAAPPVPVARLALDLNLDMLSRSTAGELYVTGIAHRPGLRPLVEAVACVAPVRLMTGHDKGSPPADDWTGQSDHAAFHARGIPFLYFGVEDHPDYHQPTDDPDRADRGFFVGAVRTVLAAVALADRRLREVAALRAAGRASP